MLLHHCRSQVAPGQLNLVTNATHLTDLSTIVFRSYPFFKTNSVIRLWWPFIQTDRVLFHVILQLSALNLETLKSQPDGDHSRQLMRECIRLLRERVQDEILGISDQTIVAVANLTAIEVNDLFSLIPCRLSIFANGFCFTQA